MEDYEIEKGGVYAFVGPRQPLVEPLKATVLSNPVDGWVQVTISHPDCGVQDQRVKTSELAGVWDADLRGGTRWSQVADRTYQRTLGQREIARRLTALGIPRSERHYAGRGGTADDYAGHTSDLYLGHHEFDLLLTLAEVGHKYTQTTDQAMGDALEERANKGAG